MKILPTIIAVIVALGGYLVGAEITISEQMPLYESLRNTSAIIFGVMGAWIAILYPNALLKIYSKIEITESEKESKNIQQLISPMVLATFIVSFVLIVGLIAPIFRRIPLLLSHHELMRSISFSTLCTLTFLQLWALIATLAPSDMILRKFKFTIKKRKKIKQILPNIGK
jgi:H+/Cl- antiporter ClcA